MRRCEPGFASTPRIIPAAGRPIKIGSIIDEHTRECLGSLVERSITGEHLIAELDRLATERGTYPEVLRCDNGPELACSAMAERAAEQVGQHFILPGEPWRNGYVESFNSRTRDKCNITSFWSLAHACVVISDWKEDYNRHRRHSALGYRPLAVYATVCRHRGDSAQLAAERAGGDRFTEESGCAAGGQQEDSTRADSP